MDYNMIRIPEHLGTRRNQDCDIGTVATVPLGTLSVTTPLRFENPFILEMKKRIDTIGAFHIHIAAIPAVSSAWAAPGHKFFPSKGDAAVSSRSGNHMYFRTIDEQVFCSNAVNPLIAQ